MDRNNHDLLSVVSFINSHDHFLILTHDRPDGDTVGSGYALANILKEHGKKAGLFFNPDAGSKLMPYFEKAPVEFSEDEATVIAVDIADTKLLFTEEKHLENKIALVIDHHHNNRVKSPINYINENAAATCELMYHLAKSLGVRLNEDASQGIYLGIMTDTGCFKYSNVTPDTLWIASEALKCGAKGQELAREWFIKKSRDRLKSETAIISSLQYYENGKISVGIMTLDRLRELNIKEEDINGLASLTILADGCEVGIFIKETEDHDSKVSVRTDLIVDAAELCALFGGGGHTRAAGCMIPKNPYAAAEMIIEEAKKRL